MVGYSSAEAVHVPVQIYAPFDVTCAYHSAESMVGFLMSKTETLAALPTAYVTVGDALLVCFQ